MTGPLGRRDAKGVGIRERILGGPGRLGLWTLPLFIAVGLLGAVLAGALATVLYTQRVASLERETAEARQELGGAVERVSEASEEGIEAIRREAQSVLDAVAVNPPIEDPLEAGVVAVRVIVVVEQPEASPRQEQPPADETSGEEDDSDEETDADDGSAEDEEEDAPEAPAPRTQTRLGSGVAVIVADGRTFIATSYTLVADPLRPGRAVETAEILVGRERLTAEVRSWHPERDLALLETGQVQGLVVAEWRPADEPLASGDGVFLAGMLPGGTLAQVGATIAAADDEVHLIDVPVASLLRGAAILDGQGRLVAIASTAYSAYGQDPGHAGVPVRMLCERLVRCGDEDLGTGDDP